MVVGAGAFGKVFKGSNKADPSQKVAIKVMDKTKHSEKELDHLLGEVQLMQNIDHPNIVKYYETYNDYKYLYIVMEMCEGGEFGEVIQSDPSSFNEVYISKQIYKLLRALSHCHSMNIIHRDIKPSNIMIGGNDHVKFIDFGIAMVMNKDNF